MNIIALSYGDLALASLLIFLNAGLSLVLRLRLEKELLIAALRMVVQLFLVGLVLKVLFTTVSPYLTGFIALAMILFAGREILARQERRLAGWWAYGLGTTSMLMAAMIVTVLALVTQLQPDPWYHPRYAIPILGMILGNTMTGIALGLNTLATTIGRERVAIEARLALGQTWQEAFSGVVREAMRSGLIPIVNAMAATGLVSLPGMMTGQILAGAEPMHAIEYQILIMFLIAGGTGLGVFTAVLGGAYRLTDSRHRLRLDRLHRTGQG
ncbi:MAG: ABC transporter permease [Alphaproteobacteria bacterium]